MSGTRYLRNACFIVLATMALLRPLPAPGQELSSPFADRVAASSALAPSATDLSQPSTPAVNAFERPGNAVPKASGDADSPDTLLVQLDRKRISTAAAYAFTAPPSFYASRHSQFDPADWNSSMSGAISTALNQDGTTTLRMSSDLELDGQQRDATASGAPPVQQLTLEWELSRLLPTKLGALVVAAGRYQQHLISYPAYANGPLTDVLLGYSASSVGFETTFTLPDRNMSLSIRYGTERLISTPDRSHTTSFQFSWTW